MGLRLTSEAVAKEILEGWFTTPFGPGEDAENVAQVSCLEAKCCGARTSVVSGR